MAELRTNRNLNMSNVTAIHALEEHLARDRQKLEELQAREKTLLANIPHGGFQAATTGAHLRREIDGLYNSIRHREQLLVMARK